VISLPSTGPFVLLDDARNEGASAARLYRDPIRIIEAQTREGLFQALDDVAAAQAQGLHAAGYMSYDAGAAFEDRLSLSEGGETPLLWFGLFDRYDKIAPGDVAALLPFAAGAWAGAPTPAVTRAEYGTALAKVKAYIEAGDIYQANLTFPCSVATAGHPLALYAGLRARAGAGYGGVIWTGTDWLLSLSPELFFALKDGKITTKPMKGTATRDAHDDARAIRELASDPKQRAENLMIVDLLRNDLSRIAQPGSVKVPELFHVETYPTVHQMTSTVTAAVKDGLGVSDILRAIFPCGSITGAPKIRAMEIVAEVETGPRGAYTGSIGRIDANGDAAFNVAIRTLKLRGEGSRATLGLGSGIVADSDEEAEWDECLAKGKFVADPRRFDLIETMRFDPEGGIALLDRHIARIKASADALGFAFDRHNARNELQAATFRIAQPRRVRLMLSPSGQIAVEINALHPMPDGPIEVSIVLRPVPREDFRLSHKTSDRAFYREALASAGTFEVALIDPDGFLTEGSFTNLFVKRDGVLITPPLSRGLLPGVMRSELIDRAMAKEADLRAEDLAGGFFIGNASRGLMAARLRD
jgi:para-aminobenzoate synthetase / 4-amino-4-deoxychorismate lyase